MKVNRVYLVHRGLIMRNNWVVSDFETNLMGSLPTGKRKSETVATKRPFSSLGIERKESFEKDKNNWLLKYEPRFEKDLIVAKAKVTELHQHLSNVDKVSLLVVSINDSISWRILAPYNFVNRTPWLWQNFYTPMRCEVHEFSS